MHFRSIARFVWSIAWLAAVAQTACAQVIIAVDASAGRHPISPYIYGVAPANVDIMADLNVTTSRWGGNPSSTYNWGLNARNAGRDWYFESASYKSTVAGSVVDELIGYMHTDGVQPIITIPTLGWVARLGPNRAKLGSYSVAKYGQQTAADGDWGNGILASTGKWIEGNDPNDAHTPVASVYQQDWVQHLVSQWGDSGSGGVPYYAMDNEPSIWHGTHHAVHPVGATMQEVLDKIVDYAGKIKDVDPGAMILGPEEWGWSGFFYSGYDLQYGSEHGWSFLPDRVAHNGWDYVPWILDQLRQYEALNGGRLLDILTVHWYPQGGEYSSDTSIARQLKRNRSTRSLWDPNYVDESWINSKVQLIPRLKNWSDTYYPGTLIGITEYNWGAESHINGATALADVLGIFGRESLDYANYWVYPTVGSPAYKAFMMYRNYDGAKSAFGDQSVSAVVPDPDSLSAFASTRSADGALTVMAINKVSTGSTPVTLALAGFTAADTAQAWQLTSTNAITRLTDLTVANGLITTTVPPQSITLFVVPKPTGPPPPTGLTATPGNGQVTLNWNASIGATSYNVKRSTASGGPYTQLANVLAPTYTDTGLTNGITYYYVVSALSASGESANSAEASASPNGLNTLALNPASVAGGNNVTGTVNLPAAAASDILVTLANTNPAATVPSQVTVPAGTKTATFQITTTVVTSVKTGTVKATLYGVSRSATLKVRPIGVQLVALNPTSVYGGLKSNGSVTLEAPAAPGDILIGLTSNSALARIQDAQDNPISSLSIPAGQQTGAFVVQTSGVTATVTARITATANGVSKSAYLTIKPDAALSYTAAPNPITGTREAIGTVTLATPATQGDVMVTLTTSNAAAAHPVDPQGNSISSIIVPSGLTSVTVRIVTGQVIVSTNVTLSATAGGVKKSVILAVKPITVAAIAVSPNPVKGGLDAVATIGLNVPAGPSGVTVTLTTSNGAKAWFVDSHGAPITSIAIPTGSESTAVTVKTSAVTAIIAVTLKAIASGVAKSTVLTLTP